MRKSVYFYGRNSMATATELVVVGVNFRKTALETRGRFAFTSEQIRALYESGITIKDFFILSTCNRTEIYAIAEQSETLISLFITENNLDAEEVKSCVFVRTGHQAIKHLFRVAAGLDSQIVGDHEIIGQLKMAFQLSKSLNRLGGYMEKVVNSALHASRQVKQHTKLSDGTTSVSYAVVQLLKEIGQSNNINNICLMGLGKIGIITLKNLNQHLSSHAIVVVNRNDSKAQDAAQEYNVEYVPFQEQQTALQKSDVLIVATGADKAVIQKTNIASTGIKYIFDLSVPSNVSADVRELDGVKLFNIDELSSIVNEALEKRRLDVPLAETIVEEYFQEFLEWEIRRNQYSITPTIVEAKTIAL